MTSRRGEGDRPERCESALSPLLFCDHCVDVLSPFLPFSGLILASGCL